MKTLVVTVLGLGACNLDSNLPAVDLDAPTNVPTDAPSRCDLSKQFGPRMPLSIEVNGSTGFSPRLTRDERTVFFSRGSVLSFATGSGTTGSFGAAMNVPNIERAGIFEFQPTFTTDGLTVYLVVRESGGTNDIYVSTRNTTTAEFGPRAGRDHQRNDE